MRYAVDKSIKISEYLDYDVVIIGSGLAGLYTTLNIDEDYSCCIISKESVDISSSWFAQGGIAAAVSGDDTPLLHKEDTLVAGAGLCNEEAVEILADEGPSDIKNLVSMNVPFDINEFGDLLITREGGHSKRRIVHAGGDATGRETVKALAYQVASGNSVTFMGKTFFIDVLTDAGGAVCGILALSESGYIVIRTHSVVIATGGIGQVYKTSTNPAVATGDGIAAAMRAGAALKNIEFIQFHPTGLWDPKQPGQAFLISEAVRGEGGVLRNKYGERFMENVHKLKDLAPRDIVARAILSEMERTGEDHVYLDITNKSDQFLSSRFPTIYRECLKRGIIISRDMIPVCPVQHYLIGGVEVDFTSQSSVRGLYICGEASSTGVHGANRLASNSMLECLVFGRRAAENINLSLSSRQPEQHLPEPLELIPPPRASMHLDYGALRARIQSLMSDFAGVRRNGPHLTFALNEVSAILQKLSGGFENCQEYIECLNIATVAQAIIRAALARKDSVGAHYREDSAK